VLYHVIDIVKSGSSLPMFRKNVLPPSSGSNNKPSKKTSNQKAANSRLATSLFACSPYSSTLKMEAVYSSETFVNSHQATRRHVSEDRTSNLTASATDKQRNQVQCYGFDPGSGQVGFVVDKVALG
jgi:hypothetical protein